MTRSELRLITGNAVGIDHQEHLAVQVAGRTAGHQRGMVRAELCRREDRRHVGVEASRY